MDEFGVLMDSIGFKPKSKTPLVNLKPKHNNFTKPTTTNNTSSSSSFLDPCSLRIEELDVIFTNPVHVNNNTLQSHNLLGDVFDQFGSIDFNSNSNNLLLEINEKHEDVFGIFDEPSSSNVEYEEKGLDFEDWVKEFENQSKRSTFNSIVDEEQQSNLDNVQHDNDTESIDQRSVETLDYDIKRWAAGKEGNLRALLSSLQQVLWPECAWHPVSLADLITSDSVNKVYKKATLYVHPDKVQQKNLQQKYIAEKVFHLLQDARNKFRAEELQ